MYIIDYKRALLVHIWTAIMKNVSLIMDISIIGSQMTVISRESTMSVPHLDFLTSALTPNRATHYCF